MAVRFGRPKLEVVMGGKSSAKPQSPGTGSKRDRPRNPSLVVPPELHRKLAMLAAALGMKTPATIEWLLEQDAAIAAMERAASELRKSIDASRRKGASG